jgi:hypothetical protein
LSRCLSSTSLMRFRSSPAPPAAPCCLYISRRRRRRRTTQRCSLGCRAGRPLHAGSAIGEARARARVRARKGGDGRSTGGSWRELRGQGGTGVQKCRTRPERTVTGSDGLEPIGMSYRYFRLSQPGIDLV